MVKCCQNSNKFTIYFPNLSLKLKLPFLELVNCNYSRAFMGRDVVCLYWTSVFELKWVDTVQGRLLCHFCFCLPFQWGLPLEGKNLLLLEQFFFILESIPILKGFLSQDWPKFSLSQKGQKKNMTVYPYTLRQVQSPIRKGIFFLKKKRADLDQTVH